MGIKGFRRKRNAKVAAFFPTFASYYGDGRVKTKNDSSLKKPSNPDLAGIPHESLSSVKVCVAKNTPIRGLTGPNVFYD
jgi:hypothetical protein